MASLNDLLNGLNKVTQTAQPTQTNQLTSSQSRQPTQENQLIGEMPSKSGNLLDATASQISCSEIYATDLTQLESFEDSIDYMKRIDEMPSLEDIIKSWEDEAAQSVNALNEEQKDLLSLVQKNLNEIAESIDLKQIDMVISAIMERLQENPEIINTLRPNDMRILINSFDRLYTTKSTVAEARKEKAASKKSAKAKQTSFLENLEMELDL